MQIDKEGIPHDFCTSISTSEFPLQDGNIDIETGNSNIVAEKVQSWVDEIIEAHEKELF